MPLSRVLHGWPGLCQHKTRTTAASLHQPRMLHVVGLLVRRRLSRLFLSVCCAFPRATPGFASATPIPACPYSRAILVTHRMLTRARRGHDFQYLIRQRCYGKLSFAPAFWSIVGGALCRCVVVFVSRWLLLPRNRQSKHLGNTTTTTTKSRTRPGRASTTLLSLGRPEATGRFLSVLDAVVSPACDSSHTWSHIPTFVICHARHGCGAVSPLRCSLTIAAVPVRT